MVHFSIPWSSVFIITIIFTKNYLLKANEKPRLASYHHMKLINDSVMNITIPINISDSSSSLIQLPSQDDDYLWWNTTQVSVNEFDRIVHLSDGKICKMEKTKFDGNVVAVVEFTLLNISAPFETEYILEPLRYGNSNRTRSVWISVERYVKFQVENFLKDQDLNSSFEIPNYIIKMENFVKLKNPNCYYTRCIIRQQKEEKCEIFQGTSRHVNAYFLNEAGSWKVETSLKTNDSGILSCFLQNEKIRAKTCLFRSIRTYREIDEIIRIVELKENESKDFESMSHRITSCASIHSGFSKVKWQYIFEDYKKEEIGSFVLNMSRYKTNTENCVFLNQFNYQYSDLVIFHLFLASITIAGSEFAVKIVQVDCSNLSMKTQTCEYQNVKYGNFSNESAKDKFGDTIMLNSSVDIIDFDCDNEGFPKLPESWQSVSG